MKGLYFCFWRVVDQVMATRTAAGEPESRLDRCTVLAVKYGEHRRTREQFDHIANGVGLGPQLWLCRGGGGHGRWRYPRLANSFGLQPLGQGSVRNAII